MLDARLVAGPGAIRSLSETERALLARYVEAFERYDIDALVSLAHEDASISMPPLELWLRGREDLRGWYLGHGSVCGAPGSCRFAANGSPAFAQYHASGPGGRHEPWCIQVLEIVDGRIAHVHHFLGSALFARFGLPAQLA